MDPIQTERARESANVLKAILEEVRIVKEYILEVRKTQGIIRQELRNLDKLKPLKKTA